MRLADAHIHLFAHEDLARYERLRADAGVDAALVVGFEGTPAHRGNNQLILRLTCDRPHLTPLAFVPATAPSPEGLAALAAEGFLGVSLYLTDDRAAEQLAAWPASVVRAVAARFPIVSVNVRAELVGRVAPTLAALEPATVLVSHLGLPGRFSVPPTPEVVGAVLHGLLALATHDHVGVKLSGYYATTEPRHRYPHDPARPFVDTLVDRFGPARSYWGSDFPPSLNFVSFRQAVDCYLPSALSPAERAAVMGGNLRTLISKAGAAARTS